ncbi:MAG: hypothetical protein QOD94_624 [Alphaproteobacteria bacterium]|nr:hypothetical protein [Alphaproteobacteria bacterium]
MSKRRDFSVLEKQVHQDRSYFPSMTVLFAVSAIALGAGVMLALPEDTESKSPAAPVAASVPETTGSTAADESFCDKQAWPYVDQRCAQRIEAARGTRQVRIVTDKGNSVTVRTPEPIVEPKPTPASQPPVVARVEKPIGPPAAPVAAPPPQVEKVVATPQQQAAPAPQNPAPQAAPASTVQVTAVPQRSAPAPQNPPPQSSPPPAPATVQASVTPANPPVASDDGGRDTSNPSANIRNAAVAPAAASTAPVAAGVDAFADAKAKKTKSARAAEKAAKREAKRQKAIEEDNGDVAEDVVATVKAAPADGQNSRRTRNAVSDRARGGVPEEVLQAVEQATASESRGRRSRQTETVDSPRSGTRIYVVPSNQIAGW